MSQASSVESDLLPVWREMIEVGGTLPSEEALAARLGHSRPAVREALIRMEAAGLIARHHGSGTFPNPAALDIPVRMDRAADFADRMAAAGHDAEMELLDAEVLPARTPCAERLTADPELRVLRTVKRWRADRVAAVVAVDLVPMAARTTDAEAIEVAGKPMRLLSGLIGLGHANWMCTWPTATELNDETARLLHYERRRAVLQTEVVGVDRHGQRVFHALEHHRPGVFEYGLISTVLD